MKIRPLVEYVSETRTGVYFRVGSGTCVKWSKPGRFFRCLNCDKNDCPHTRIVEKSEDGLVLIMDGLSLIQEVS
jgi:hypothetical protein